VVYFISSTKTPAFKKEITLEIKEAKNKIGVSQGGTFK